MAHQKDDSSQNIYFLIAEKFRQIYYGQVAYLTKSLAQMESLEYRQQLANTAPELARLYEARTINQKQTAVRELATSVAVAHAIVFALEKFRHGDF